MRLKRVRKVLRTKGEFSTRILIINRTILKYLIPLKALKGIYPSSELYVKYGIINVYPTLFNAIQSGDVFEYEKLLESHQTLWIDLGVFILLEKLSWVCFRNLCKRIWFLFEMKNQIDIKMISRGIILNGGSTSNVIYSLLSLMTRTKLNACLQT